MFLYGLIFNCQNFPLSGRGTLPSKRCSLLFCFVYIYIFLCFHLILVSASILSLVPDCFPDWVQMFWVQPMISFSIYALLCLSCWQCFCVLLSIGFPIVLLQYFQVFTLICFPVFCINEYFSFDAVNLLFDPCYDNDQWSQENNDEAYV